jgi:hypothetical protein
VSLPFRKIGIITVAAVGKEAIVGMRRRNPKMKNSYPGCVGKSTAHPQTMRGQQTHYIKLLLKHGRPVF